MAIIKGEGIVKKFETFDQSKNVLNGVSLNVEPGEFLTIMGPSGSGKSTLMYALSGMDHINDGKIFFLDEEVTKLGEQKLADLRRNKMGFVFQQATFLSNLNLMDNIILPAIRENAKSKRDIIARAHMLMKTVGIEDLGTRDISQVSGGQLQRAGICRALINEPLVIFGDEPTGALNSKTSKEIMDIFCQINQRGTTIILVTHDVKVASVSDRIKFLSDGEICDELHLGKYQDQDFEKRVSLVTEKMLNLGI